MINGELRNNRLFQAVLVGAIVELLVLLNVHSSLGGFTAGIDHPSGSNYVASGTLVNQVTANGTICASSADAISSDSDDCAGSLLGPTAAVTQINQGSDLGTAAMTAGSCGAEGLVDASTAGSNPGLVYGGMTLDQAGDADVFGQMGAEFDGSSSYATTSSEINYGSAATFTIAGWFKTPATADETGVLASFSGEQNPEVNAPGANDWDKYIYVRNNANDDYLYLEIDSGGTDEYEDVGTALAPNTWYFFAAEDSSATGKTMSVTLDATTADKKEQDTDDDSGYWTLGYGYDATSLPKSKSPYADYFDGELSDLAIFPSALTSAQLTALYGGGTISQLAYAGDVVADGATSFWPLSDNGSYLYPEAIAGVTGDVCGLEETSIQETVAAGTQCVSPAGAGSCPELGTGNTLASLEDAQLGMADLDGSESGAITVSLATVGSAPKTAVGLHLTLPLELVLSAGSWNASISYAVQAVMLT